MVIRSEVPVVSNEVLDSESDSSDEPTAVHRRDAFREGADVGNDARSVDAIFEHAKAVGTTLPTAFLFAIFAEACAELAERERRRLRADRPASRRSSLEPNRIFVAFDGRVKIEDAEPRATGDSDGTRSYRSPEERRGLPVDERSALFSLTLVVAELFVLKRLSSGTKSIVDSEGWGEFAALLRGRKRVPRELGVLFLRSLSEHAEQRPRGPAALLDDLDRIARKRGLDPYRSIIANHMGRLFPTVRSVSASPPETAREPWGSLDVFATLSKPAPATVRQILPPAIVAGHRPLTSPESVSALRPPLPAFAAAAPVASAHADAAPPSAGDSEPPPTLVRTIPPPEPEAPALPVTRRSLWSVPRVAVSREIKVVAAVALVAAAVAVVFPKNGKGRVTTVVNGIGGALLPDAELIVDGEQKCKGARCTFESAEGVHEVAARAHGYLPQLQVVAVRPREATAVNFRLERAGSSLDISGYPEGASLIVDGQWIGRLPLHAEVSPGVHKLRVEADRFLSEERTVELGRGDTRKIDDVALVPRMGRLKIDIRTPGADVALVSGSEIREHLDFSQPIDLDLSRQWTLEVTKAGYRTLREPLSWNGASEKTFVVALEKLRTTRAAERAVPFDKIGTPNARR